MPPGRGAELFLQSSMRFHAADIEVVIRLWRLPVRIGPGEADAGRAAADAGRLEHGNVCPGLSQPKGDRGAHHPSADHDHLRHGRLLNFRRIMACHHRAVARRRHHRGNVLALRYFLAEDLECILTQSHAVGDLLASAQQSAPTAK